MRVLLFTHPPLDAEGGAAQLALNLAAALRDRGHDAVAWSPEPIPGARWHDLWLHQRRRLESFLATTEPFDVVDLPAVSLSRRVASAAGLTVARSVQPELRYLAAGLRPQFRWRSRHRWRAPVHALHGAVLSAAVIRGWSRADRILTLGTDELEWMASRLPWTRPKLACYVVAPSPEDRRALAAIRNRRHTPAADRGLRFLWIGRWVSQKGIDRLTAWLMERAAAGGMETVTLAGCGSQAEGSLPESLIASGRVKTVPSFSRRELPALLAAHDAGLFTSPVEGWGLSLNEMLESGMPVFATEAGAVRDLRPHFPTGLRSFPPPPDLAARDLEPLEVSTAYLERFSWESIARSWEGAVLEDASTDRRRSDA